MYDFKICSHLCKDPHALGTPISGVQTVRPFFRPEHWGTEQLQYLPDTPQPGILVELYPNKAEPLLLTKGLPFKGLRSARWLEAVHMLADSSWNICLLEKVLKASFFMGNLGAGRNTESRYPGAGAKSGEPPWHPDPPASLLHLYKGSSPVWHCCRENVKQQIKALRISREVRKNTSFSSPHEDLWPPLSPWTISPELPRERGKQRGTRSPPPPPAAPVSFPDSPAAAIAVRL